MTDNVPNNKPDKTDITYWIDQLEKWEKGVNSWEREIIPDCECVRLIEQEPEIADRVLDFIGEVTRDDWCHFPYGNACAEAVKANFELANKAMDVVIQSGKTTSRETTEHRNEVADAMFDIVLLQPKIADRCPDYLGEWFLSLAEETDKAETRNKAVEAMCAGNFKYDYSTDTYQAPCFSNISHKTLCKIAEKGLEKDTIIKVLHRLAKESGTRFKTGYGQEEHDGRYNERMRNIYNAMDNMIRIDRGEFYLRCSTFECTDGGETVFDVKFKKEKNGFVVTEVKDRSPEYMEHNYGWEFNPLNQNFEGLSAEEFRYKIEHMYDDMDDEYRNPYIRTNYISAAEYYDGSNKLCEKDDKVRKIIEKDDKIAKLVTSIINKVLQYEAQKNNKQSVKLDSMIASKLTSAER